MDFTASSFDVSASTCLTDPCGRLLFKLLSSGCSCCRLILRLLHVGLFHICVCCLPSGLVFWCICMALAAPLASLSAMALCRSLGTLMCPMTTELKDNTSDL